MTVMIKWFKKDPFLHGVFILCTPVFIGLLLIVGLFIYINIQLLDPNYVEFGPFITLYKSKDCAKPEASQYGDCLVYGNGTGIYKNNPPTLYQEIKTVVAGVSERFKTINFNPLDPSQWECSVDGRIISNIQERVQVKKTYKCWPK